MSRTIKGSKGPGYDYWKRREHFSAICPPGSHWKRLTNRVHRRIAQRHLERGDLDGVDTVHFRQRGMTGA